jgi:hypothetical protein
VETSVGGLRVQREIEELLRTFHLEQRREQKLINDVLAAMAVGAAARQRMVQDIANAVLEAISDNESVAAGAGSPTESPLASAPASEASTTEKELTSALQSMLRETEGRGAPASH